MQFLVAVLVFILNLSLPVRAQGKTWLVVHSAPAAMVRNGAGEELGATGRPINIDLPAGPGGVELRLEAVGYQPLVLHLEVAELQRVRRLPPFEGSYQLEPLSRRINPYLWPALLAPVPLLAFLWRRVSRKNVPPEEVDFVLGPEIGSGGTSTVYRGRCSRVGEEFVAIKLVKPEVCAEEENRLRFLRELEVCRSLSHPALVTVYHCGTDPQGRLFMVMELLLGKSLFEWLSSQEPLPLELVRDWLTAVCDVLGYLHDNGIVHRDVKPQNIFICEDGRVKLLDLGIARGLDFVEVTRTGMAIGTPHYMAPEQSQGDLAPQSDQYSVGVMMFEMLAGRRPFPDGDPVDVICAHVSKPPPRLADYRSGTTPLQEGVVRRLLSKTPEGRFAGMREVISAINQALTPSPEDEVTV